MPLIDREHNGDILLIDKNFAELEDNTGCAFFLKLTELEDNIKCASLSKLTDLVKKPSNQTRTGKEKPHCLMSYFIEPICNIITFRP